MEDVQARTETQLTPVQRALAAVYCADASAMAHNRVPNMANPPPPTAVGVVCTAVLRALNVPADGLKEEAIGGHSRTSAHEGGGLYLTDDELDLLRPTPNGGAFSIWT